ncbi:MAG: ABC transporter permease [Lachnospiraceae bacterium]|nr:ABC transporter permease [Lachnospiraceae bacterium]
MKLEKVVKPIISIVLALLLGAVVIRLVGEDPLEIYYAMFNGAFGSKNAIAGTLVKTTTMIFVGLSYGFAYKCGLVNIGIDGQLYIGALFSAVVGIYVSLPMIIHIPLCLAAGFLGGALWGGLAGWLKTRFHASEMITTVMLNYVATYISSFLCNGILEEEKGTYPQSESVLDSAILPTLIPHTQLTIGFLLAIVACVIYAIYWKRTACGFRMTVVGESGMVAQYAGIQVPRMTMLAMAVSGGIGGLAGTMEVLGVQHKIMEGLSAGYGFDGIAVSLVGNNSGPGIFISSFLFGVLRYGGNAIQMFTKLPIAVIYILQALVIVFTVTEFRRRKRRRKDR